MSRMSAPSSHITNFTSRTNQSSGSNSTSSNTGASLGGQPSSALMKLPFTVVDCSSYEENYDATNLEPLPRGSKMGWRGAPNAPFPQTLTLDFGRPVSIEKLQILCHQSLIPSSLDLVAFIEDSGRNTSAIQGPKTSSSSHLYPEMLGYMVFGENTQSNFQARELKTVTLSTKNVRMLKIIVLGCHKNPLNPANQASLIAIHVVGKGGSEESHDKEMPLSNRSSGSTSDFSKPHNHRSSLTTAPTVSSLSPSPYHTSKAYTKPSVSTPTAVSLPFHHDAQNLPSSLMTRTSIPESTRVLTPSTIPGTPLRQLEPLDFRSLRSLPLRQVTVILTSRKFEAATAEDYEEAKRCKVAAELLSLHLPSLDALDEEKRLCVSVEDFDGAKKSRESSIALTQKAWESLFKMEDTTGQVPFFNASAHSQHSLDVRKETMSLTSNSNSDSVISTGMENGAVIRDGEILAFSKKSLDDVQGQARGLQADSIQSARSLSPGISIDATKNTRNITPSRGEGFGVNATVDAVDTLPPIEARFVEKIQKHIGLAVALQCISKQFVVRQAALKAIADTIPSTLGSLDHPKHLSNSNPLDSENTENNEEEDEEMDDDKDKSNVAQPGSLSQRHASFFEGVCEVIVRGLGDTTVVIIASLELFSTLVTAYVGRARVLVHSQPQSPPSSGCISLLSRISSAFTSCVKLLPALFGAPNTRVRGLSQEIVEIFSTSGDVLNLSPLFAATQNISSSSSTLISKPAVLKGRLSLLLLLVEKTGLVESSLADKLTALTPFVTRLTRSSLALALLSADPLHFMPCLSIEDSAALITVGLTHRDAGVRDMASAVIVLSAAMLGSTRPIWQHIPDSPEKTIPQTLIAAIEERVEVMLSHPEPVTNPCIFFGLIGPTTSHKSISSGNVATSMYNMNNMNNPQTRSRYGANEGGGGVSSDSSSLASSYIHNSADFDVGLGNTSGGNVGSKVASSRRGQGSGTQSSSTAGTSTVNRLSSARAGKITNMAQATGHSHGSGYPAASSETSRTRQGQGGIGQASTQAHASIGPTQNRTGPTPSQSFLGHPKTTRDGNTMLSGKGKSQSPSPPTQHQQHKHKHYQNQNQNSRHTSPSRRHPTTSPMEFDASHGYESKPKRSGLPNLPAPSSPDFGHLDHFNASREESDTSYTGSPHNHPISQLYAGRRFAEEEDVGHRSNDEDHDQDHDDNEQYGLGKVSPVPYRGTSTIQSNAKAKGEHEPTVDEEMENGTEDVCQFCGFESPETIDGSNVDDALDMHYWRDCPMLTQCLLCGQVIEISNVLEHLRMECEQAQTTEAQHQIELLTARIHETVIEVSIPTGTNEAMLRRALETGEPKDMELAMQTGSVYQCCPLCFQPIAPGEEGWQEHLLHPPFCSNNPRSVPDSRGDGGSSNLQ